MAGPAGCTFNSQKGAASSEGPAGVIAMLPVYARLNYIIVMSSKLGKSLIAAIDKITNRIILLLQVSAGLDDI